MTRGTDMANPETTTPSVEGDQRKAIATIVASAVQKILDGLHVGGTVLAEGPIVTGAARQIAALPCKGGEAEQLVADFLKAADRLAADSWDGVDDHTRDLFEHAMNKAKWLATPTTEPDTGRGLRGALEKISGQAVCVGMDGDEGNARMLSDIYNIAEKALAEEAARLQSLSDQNRLTGGWRAVPEEPIGDMQGAGELAFLKAKGWASHLAIPKIWQAMLAASPPPPDTGGWRDIGTIPADTRSAIMWGTLTHYGDPVYEHEDAGRYNASKSEGRWWVLLPKGNGDTWDCEIIPTHWHPHLDLGEPPLPLPGGEEKEEGGASRETLQASEGGRGNPTLAITKEVKP